MNGTFNQGQQSQQGQGGFADPFDQFSNYDTTGVTEDTLNSGGAVSAPGKFHFMVQGVTCEAPDPDDSNPRTPCARIDLEVLPAPYPTEAERSQIGKKCFLRCYVAKKRVKKKVDVNGNTVYDAKGEPEYELEGWDPISDGQRDVNLRVALALGIITSEQLGQSNTQITKAMWESCTGRQCCGEVTASEDEYKGQTRIRHEVMYGQIYPVNHPDVANWPKDLEALQLAMAQGGMVGVPQGYSPQQLPPQPSDMDDLSNLAG